MRAYLATLTLHLDIQRVTKLGRDKWFIHLARDSDLAGFYQVRGILNCRVTVRRDKKKRVTQCHNCQRFGHVSSNCGMPFRCVKCGGNHGPAKCTIPSKEEEVRMVPSTDPATGAVKRTVSYTLKCANCDANGHVASSKDCPKRLAIIGKKVRAQAPKIRAQAPQVRTFPQNSGRVATGISYATAAAGHSGGFAPLAPTRAAVDVRPSLTAVGEAMGHFNLVDGDCRRYFGKDFMSCLSKVGSSSRDYARLTRDDEKSQALLGLLLSMHHG